MSGLENDKLTIDGDEKRKIINRLRRIEGQVRGLEKMVREERDCQEILTLMSGIRSALNATGDVVIETYLEKCRTDLLEGKTSTKDIVKVLKLSRG